MKIEMTRYQDSTLDLGVNPNLLQDFWLKLRCTGPDLFTIKRFDGSVTQDIQKGWMPQSKETTIEDLRQCVSELKALQSFVEAKLEDASKEITRVCDFREERSDHCYCVYCKCSDGIIGVGWRFRDGDLVKAKMMAVFTLYAYGLTNADTDPVLWEVCYRHLPFAMGMDLSSADKVYIKYALAL